MKGAIWLIWVTCTKEYILKKNYYVEYVLNHDFQN
jgi:hypothetical protein